MILMWLQKIPTVELSKRLAALVILLWWGGLNCLAGCLIPSTSVSAESHCSMSAEGDGCLAQADKDTPSSKSIGGRSTSAQPPNCCSLESLIAETNQDMRAARDTFHPTAVRRIELIFYSGPRAEPPERSARLPDRKGTRILCCVFLI
jgi:hypothetical protein